MISNDTIVAISSAVGPAARMIVRLSGPAACDIASQFGVESSAIVAGSAIRTILRFNNLELPATLYCFRAPHSATGEDVIEFHIPGNPLLARMLLDAAIAQGARAAEPGEFTARAYFNGRLDLSAAEGVSAVIAAQNQRELDGARRLLVGELSRRLRPTMELLGQTLALIEAQIDFAGEEITVLDLDQTRSRIARVDADLAKLIAESARFESLSHEPKIVLVGRPNAGKSTLLNALAGTERAIVSATAGTTRDVLTAGIKLHRGLATLIDAAGLEDVAPMDEVNRQMHAASLRAVQTADVIVLLREVSDDRPEIALRVDPHLRVRSKADLSRTKGNDLCISAHTGAGLTELRQRLDSLAFGPASTGSTLALNARHLRCIEEARGSLRRALDPIDAELISLELRESLDALGAILGAITPDDVLGKIFSTFCIGK